MDTPLKNERIRRGLSGEQVATAVGVRQATINRIENRIQRARPELAKKLANFFENKITRDQILFPEEYGNHRKAS